jgi:pseudomonalisin
MTLSRPLLGLMIAAAFGSQAHAAATWASTATHAPEVYSRSSGEALARAEAVAPGQALHITVSLQMRNRDQLDQRIAGLRAGTRQDFLTSADAVALHLPTQAQVQAVVQHLQQAGFRHIVVADNRLLVSAEGSAMNAAAAFNTQLHNFGTGADRVFANVTDAQVPASLKSTVLAVHGLQNAAGFHTMIQEPDAHPEARGGGVGHQPTDFPLIYNASGLPPATKATIGIISSGSMAPTLSDFAAFLAKTGFPSFTPTVVNTDPASTDTSGTPEWDLDSQNSLSAAGGQVKGMIFYTASSLNDTPLIQAFNGAVSANQATAVNISLGGCETSSKSSGFTASSDQIFALGVAQGQTFTVSTGDSGSKECGRRAGNAQSYPAVSPYVMAIGGTTLVTTGTTAYKRETTWKSGGGGPSLTEPAQSFQIASGVLKGATSRGVPDISFDADPNSGSIIIVNGANAQYGGTSLSAPLFAGFWARIQSQHGSMLVSPGAGFYQYGVASPSLFHDVTSGSNGGFTAVAGWDYATGFGSVDIGALATFINGHSGW